MKLGQSLLPEFEREMENTRKSLERVPKDNLDWRPHEKSMAFVGLATHMANLPSWAVLAIERDSFDIAPPGGEPPRVDPVSSIEEALAVFDKNVSDARSAISSASDETLLSSWSLLSGGKTVLTMPRIAVIRSMVMNHMIHHRAQLGVYLRLNDLAVPGMYGPTADEG
jgi:uncharacterized damage-inducible protein DinB